MKPTEMSVWDCALGQLAAWMRRLVAMGSLAAITMAVSPSEAADDPFEELRQRIDQLERDNRQLQTALGPRGSSSPDSFRSVVPPAPVDEIALNVDDPKGSAEESEDEKRIGNIVEKYLRRRPAEANPVDDSQEQRISAIQNNVAGVLDRLNKKTLPSVAVSGVFQADTGFFNQDANSLIDYGHIQNGADFRRARLGAKGSLTETTNYFMQMDFAFFGRPTFTDLWVEQKEVPILGTVRIGQWKQPFSLEVVSSFRYTTFMERSLLFQSFDPFRHLGIGFYDNADDLSATWAASVFTTGQDQFGGSIANNGGIGTAERITWLPYWNDATKGTEYLHLGVGHFFNSPANNTTTFKTIPELYIGSQAGISPTGTSGQPAPGNFNGTPPFVNTGTLKTISQYNVLGTELLWVQGPLSVQSEGQVNFVNQTGGNATAVLPGAYAQVGYFLTGEHRPYDRKAGAIDRVIPFRNFGPWSCDCEHSGWGAWEIAGRWSYLDLNDHNIQGGTITDYTAGVNWYVNPYWKIVVNYIHSDANAPQQVNGAGAFVGATPGGPHLRSSTDMLALRAQMDF